MICLTHQGVVVATAETGTWGTLALQPIRGVQQLSGEGGKDIGKVAWGVWLMVVVYSTLAYVGKG